MGMKNNPPAIPPASAVCSKCHAVVSRYVIADGTSILRNPTIYHSEAAARIAAEDAAFTRGSDHVAVYSVETGACLFTVYRSDHGTRARAVASPVPYAPNGMSWLDWSV